MSKCIIMITIMIFECIDRSLIFECMGRGLIFEYIGRSLMFECLDSRCILFILNYLF